MISPVFRGFFMTHGLKGKFIVIDGLDGIGKGVVLDAVVDDLSSKGLRVFDLHDFWKASHDHPDFHNKNFNGKINQYYKNLSDFDVLNSAEPTYVGIGKAIREEIIANNGRKYSALFTAHAYSMDRLILYNRVIMPALQAGKIVVQSRSFSTSVVYQPLQSTLQGETPLSVSDILSLEGNAYALKNAPDMFIIPTIMNVNEVMKRLDGRDKDDNCQFEKIDFQLKLKPFYESSDLKNLFEKQGTVVKYLNAGISIPETKRQAVEIYKMIMS